MDKTDDTPQRYWVIRAFSHYDARGEALDKIRCAICDSVLLTAGDPADDKTPLLMFENEPICPNDALERIVEHPLTPEYLTWMNEGDPRWWSPWFCNCDGCELSSVT